jgi:hypothetical protein
MLALDTPKIIGKIAIIWNCLGLPILVLASLHTAMKVAHFLIFIML